MTARGRWSTVGFGAAVAAVMTGGVLLLPAYLAVPESVQAAAGLTPLCIAALIAVVRAQPASPLRGEPLPVALQRAAREAHLLLAVHIGLLPALLLSVMVPPARGTLLTGGLLLSRSLSDLLLAGLVGLAVGRVVEAQPLAALLAAVGVAAVWIAAALLTQAITTPLMLMASGGSAAAPHLTGLIVAGVVSGGVWFWYGGHP